MTKELTKKQRINLRSFAQSLNDTVHIGKDGITDNVVKQVNDQLKCHEIVKIKVQQNSPDGVVDLCDELVKVCNAQVVTTIGSKIVLYKHSGLDTNSNNIKVREVLKK